MLESRFQLTKSYSEIIVIEITALNLRARNWQGKTAEKQREVKPVRLLNGARPVLVRDTTI